MGRIILLPLRPRAPEQSILWLTTREGSHAQRQWDAKTNAMLVIEGLKGKPVPEIYTAPQLRQSLYYQWRDQVLAHATSAFEVPQHTRQEARLEQENTRLKKLVGALLLE